MDMDNEELKKDLEEQYAMLETEIEEDKKKKRYLVVFIFFLVMFLLMFGTTFSYFKIYNGREEIKEVLVKDLYINEKKDAFDFDENIKKYVVSMPYGTEKVTFGYKICENCTIDITGNENLKIGSNEIKIKIVNKDTKIEDDYIIYVIVENKEENDNDSNNSGNTKPSTNPEGNTPSNSNDNNPGNSDDKNNDNEEINKDLRLKYLEVTNHTFLREFSPNNNYYITNDIFDNEDSLKVKFTLFDESNTFKLKLNGVDVERETTKEDDKNVLYLNIKTELTLGSNKLEIIVCDGKDNTNTYEVYLYVKHYNDEKVINLEVEPINGDGTFSFSNVIPGWESDGMQGIKITNKSNYDAYINLKWTEVLNEFNNKNDLSYEIKFNNKIIKSGYLPDEESFIIKNLVIKANSSSIYYFKYKYQYTDNDQNVDQGKAFKTRIQVSLQD